MKKKFQLTKYPFGSIREVFTVSWPLMLGLLASGLMVFTDRLMLSRFSIDAMNASALAGTGVFTVLILFLVVATITEVFVGQYHGHGESHKMGAYVWQMIWFSIFLFPIFFLCSRYIPGYIYSGNAYAISYFKIMVFWGSFFCLPLALTGFFAGQGLVKIVAIVSIISNLINALFDYYLIFGISFFPKMGIEGAAYATVLAQVLSTMLFFFLFLRKKNIKENGALKWKLNKKYFTKCLKVGFPFSIAHFSEFSSHLVFFLLMSKMGKEYLTISALMQTVYILSYFVIEGLSKGVIALSSNFIGANKINYVKKNMISSIKLQLLFGLIIISIFSLFSPELFKPFFSGGNLSIFQDPTFSTLLYKTTLYLSIFWVIDGCTWVLIGILTAAADTKFIMKVSILAPWILFLLPVYIFVTYFKIQIDKIWLWYIFYGMLLLSIYFLRYKSKKWMGNVIVKTSPKVSK